MFQDNLKSFASLNEMSNKDINKDSTIFMQTGLMQEFNSNDFQEHLQS